MWKSAKILKGSSGIAGSKIVKNLPSTVFKSKVDSFMTTVKGAVAHLPATLTENKDNDVDETNDCKLKVVSDIEPSSVFEFRVEGLKQNLCFSSPVSGLKRYQFDPKTSSWLCKEDGHDLVGLFTRDFMRCASGTPKF